MQSQPSEAVGIIYTPLFVVMVRHADTYPCEAFADNAFLEGFGRFEREAVNKKPQALPYSVQWMFGGHSLRFRCMRPKPVKRLRANIAQIAKIK